MIITCNVSNFFVFHKCFHEILERACCRLLWCYVHELCIGVFGFKIPEDSTSFSRRCKRINCLSRYAERMQKVKLILHQTQQRLEHDCDLILGHSTGKMEAQRLSRTSWHAHISVSFAYKRKYSNQNNNKRNLKSHLEEYF